MASTLLSLTNEMERLAAATAAARKAVDEAVVQLETAAATAAARKAVDEAVVQLETAEQNEKEFERKLAALAGAVARVTQQSTAVTATTSGAASGPSGALSAAPAASAVTSTQRLPKGAPKPKKVRAPKSTDRKKLPDAPPDAQASARAALYPPFDHAAAMANRCRHS
jgi:hypothetical protein